jgi:alkanesulfonate monooxygenase
MSDDLFFVNVFPTNDRQKNDFDYLSAAKNIVDLSLDLEFKYTLITTGDKRIDPFVLAQQCLNLNNNFSPLIAINPFYQHPVHVVKKIISLRKFFSSKIAINLVAGSFFGESKALNDLLSFQDKNERLLDFFQTLQSLTDQKKKAHHGSYYSAEPAEIFPAYQFEKCDFFVSGSFFPQLNSCKEAHFVQSIRPIGEMPRASSFNCGLGVGICARDTREEALKEIARIYPDDRKGEMLFGISMANNDTPWNQWFRNYLEKNAVDLPHYFLKPMTNFWCSSPFIVGSYQEVADQLHAYHSLGYNFFVLDFVPEEAPHVKKCLELIRKK